MENDALMNDDELQVLEVEIKTLRANYERAARAFLELVERRSKKADRIKALNEWHAAGTSVFNAHDKAVAIGALRKADLNSTWYTDRAETAVNWLETISLHYRALRERSSSLNIDAGSFRASPTAFANLQRIVMETHPDIGLKLRNEYIKLELPTHGFDRGASVNPDQHPLQRRFFVLGCVVALFAAALAVWAFFLSDLTKDQRSILLWILPLCSAFVSWTFAGTITAKARGWQGIAVATTGGFAIWFLSNFFLFRQ